MKTKTKVKAGYYAEQHNESVVRVKSRVQGGGQKMQHNESAVRVKSSAKRVACA